MKTYTILDCDERQHVGVEFPNGWHVLCPFKKPDGRPWALSSYQSLEAMRHQLGHDPVYLDQPKTTTTTTPPPCPNCQGEPDVITSGVQAPPPSDAAADQ